MKLILSIIFTLIVSQVVCEVIDFRPCKDEVSQCKVATVRINPCPEAARDKTIPCHIKRGRGRPAVIDFDYEAGFTATNAKGKISLISSDGGKHCSIIDETPCSRTQCPIAGIKRNYSQQLITDRNCQAGSYYLRLQLSNKEDIKEYCCFQVQIKMD